jgi:hypothetical protein
MTDKVLDLELYRAILRPDPTLLALYDETAAEYADGMGFLSPAGSWDPTTLRAMLDDTADLLDTLQFLTPATMAQQACIQAEAIRELLTSAANPGRQAP